MDNENNSADRKADAIAKARRIKAPIDLKWYVTEIEAAVAKKEAELAAAKAEKAAPAPKPEPVAQAQEASNEGADDEEDPADYEATANALRADLAAERADHAKTLGELNEASATIKDLRDTLTAVRTDLDAANLELFDYKAKYGALVVANVDKEGNPVAPPAEKAAPVAKPTAAAGTTVKVRVTKKGHDQIHTGDGVSKFKWNDEIEFPLDVAKGLEDRGFAEIQE